MYQLMCSSSCMLMGTCKSETHPGTFCKYPGVSAPCWCNLLSSPAVTYEAQGGFTVNWRGIKVQKLQGNEQMLRESRGMPRPDHNWKCLSQKSRSHSHAKGHFLHLAPTPLRWKSILHSARWVRREYFDYGSADVIQESRGVTHCIRGRDIWLRQVHPSALWGAWHFQDTENKLPLEKEYAFSVGKKERERTREGQYTLTLGWKPTIREISVLSEKVKASKCPLFQRQIQDAARTQTEAQSSLNGAGCAR